MRLSGPCYTLHKQRDLWSFRRLNPWKSAVRCPTLPQTSPRGNPPTRWHRPRPNPCAKRRILRRTNPPPRCPVRESSETPTKSDTARAFRCSSAKWLSTEAVVCFGWESRWWCRRWAFVGVWMLWRCLSLWNTVAFPVIGKHRSHRGGNWKLGGYRRCRRIHSLLLIHPHVLIGGAKSQGSISLPRILPIDLVLQVMKHFKIEKRLGKKQINMKW